jgi:hypothetical protein
MRPVRDLPPNRNITDGLNPSLRLTIPRPDVDLVDVEIGVHIRGLQYIGSYNWVDAPEPTIIVPGKKTLSHSNITNRRHTILIRNINVERRLPSPMAGQTAAIQSTPRLLQGRRIRRPKWLPDGVNTTFAADQSCGPDATRLMSRSRLAIK